MLSSHQQGLLLKWLGPASQWYENIFWEMDGTITMLVSGEEDLYLSIPLSLIFPLFEKLECFHHFQLSRSQDIIFAHTLRLHPRRRVQGSSKSSTSAPLVVNLNVVIYTQSMEWVRGCFYPGPRMHAVLSSLQSLPPYPGLRACRFASPLMHQRRVWRCWLFTHPISSLHVSGVP